MSSPRAARSHNGVWAIYEIAAALFNAVWAGWYLKKGDIVPGGVFTGAAIYFALVARACLLAWQESRWSDT